MLRAPPPAGSLNACAQLPAGDGTGASACPSTEALQSPAGSESISVPPAAGTGASATPSGLDGIGTTVPPCSVTLTREGGVLSCHSEYVGVVLYGCSPMTSFSTVASCGSTGVWTSM